MSPLRSAILAAAAVVLLAAAALIRESHAPPPAVFKPDTQTAPALSAESAPALEATAGGDRDPGVRWAALLALHDRPGGGEEAIRRSAETDPSPQIRRLASKLLPGAGSDNPPPPVRRRFLR